MSAVLLAKRRTLMYLIDQLDSDYYMAILPWKPNIQIQQTRWSDDAGYIALFAGIDHEQALAVTEEQNTVDPRAQNILHLMWDDEREDMPLLIAWPDRFDTIVRDTLNAEKEFREELGVPRFTGYDKCMD